MIVHKLGKKIVMNIRLLSKITEFSQKNHFFVHPGVKLVRKTWHGIFCTRSTPGQAKNIVSTMDEKVYVSVADTEKCLKQNFVRFLMNIEKKTNKRHAIFLSSGPFLRYLPPKAKTFPAKPYCPSSRSAIVGYQLVLKLLRP